MYSFVKLRFGFLLKYFPQQGFVLKFRGNSGYSPDSAFAV